MSASRKQRNDFSKKQPAKRSSASSYNRVRNNTAKGTTRASSTSAHTSGARLHSSVQSRPASSGRSLRASARIDRIREEGHKALRETETKAIQKAPEQNALRQIQRSAKPRMLASNNSAKTEPKSAKKPARHAASIAQAKPTKHPSTVQPSALPHIGRSTNRPANKTKAPAQARTSSIGQSQLADGLWTGGGSSTSGPQSAQGATAGTKKRRFHFGWKSKCALALILVVLAGAGIDYLINGNRIYAGVSIGDIDVSGMTQDEATAALSNTYAPRVSENTIVFYTSEEAMSNPQTAEESTDIESQIAYEDTLESRSQWTVNASAVEASFDPSALAKQAYDIGRENGGIISRIQSQLNGAHIDLTCHYNNSLLLELCSEMTLATGEARVNYGFEMIDSTAQVTEGHDGNEITLEWVQERLDETLLGSTQNVECILETTYMPLQIDQEQAQKAADEVNASIASGAIFSYEDQTWEATREVLASWITSEIVPSGSSWELNPIFDTATAKNDLLSSLHSNINRDNLEVFFTVSDGQASVQTNATGMVPDTSGTLASLNETFFTTQERSEAPTITLESAELTQSLSFEDACDYGLVTEISTYTTEYSSGNEARVHNIHTAADLLTLSVCSANEGTWSFNDIAGEANEERGYEAAGSIIGGEYSDAIGGGICQVATTVFNAIYEAGYPVLERHNHSLYIASYPDGRDAAIAYPTYDLRWQNDTTSDVLLVMTYTDASLTATLWGVDPEYQVSTEVGEWQKGESYSTKYKTDSSLSAGTEYVETSGVNGSSITVVRTVKSKDGTVLHTDEFNSTYEPKNKVIVEGTG